MNDSKFQWPIINPEEITPEYEAHENKINIFMQGLHYIRAY